MNTVIQILTNASIIILGAAVIVMNQAKDELRKDVNRVSVIQVRCAGQADYGRCVDRELTRWANASR